MTLNSISCSIPHQCNYVETNYFSFKTYLTIYFHLELKIRSIDFVVRSRDSIIKKKFIDGYISRIFSCSIYMLRSSRLNPSMSILKIPHRNCSKAKFLDKFGKSEKIFSVAEDITDIRKSYLMSITT